ncbi:MAG: type II toxin-antitoxin system RelE/ParE family toxin [Deltaproteobacteria bacterium]|nr:type II toxin-antitoxin system RelE/ParE family toxin [Deltaproteobacteria bacterium]
MMKSQVFESQLFKRKRKGLNRQEISSLDSEVQLLMKSPEMGEGKRGEYEGVYIHRFKGRQKMLIVAYEVGDRDISLLTLGEMKLRPDNLR